MRKMTSTGRWLIGAAIGIGMWSSRHRVIASLAVVALLVASVGGAIFTARALDSNIKSSGTTAPGSHTIVAVPDTGIEVAFCNVCHNDIAVELVNTTHGAGGGGAPWGQGEYLDSCLDCHAPDPTSDHLASGAKCADCHGPTDEITCEDCHGTTKSGTGCPGWHSWCGSATELATDVHGSMLGDMGETASTASWTCKACHTLIDVTVTATDMGALDFDLAIPNPSQ